MDYLSSIVSTQVNLSNFQIEILPAVPVTTRSFSLLTPNTGTTECCFVTISYKRGGETEGYEGKRRGEGKHREKKRGEGLPVE